MDFSAVRPLVPRNPPGEPAMTLYLARDLDGEYTLFQGKPTFDGSEWNSDEVDCTWLVMLKQAEGLPELAPGECCEVRLVRESSDE